MLPASAALPLDQRCLDGDGAVEAGEEIGDRDARLLRRPVGLAGYAHDPRHALDKKVVAGSFRVGPGLTETSHRAINEPRVEAVKRIVVEAELGEPADLEVLDQDIRARRKPAHDFAAPIGCEVGDNRALAAIARVEIGGRRLAIRLDKRRSPGARFVAARALDLDDVGAEIGQRLARRRAGEHARELDDAQAGKRARAQKNACRPVCARPRISACTSWVPS